MKPNHIGAAASGLCAIVLCAGAYAGAVTVSTVAVDSNSASGALALVRNTTDSTQYIECFSGASSQTTAHYAQCVARSATRAYFSCTTHNPKLIAVAQSVSANSFITVSSHANLANGDRECTHLTVFNSSRYLP